MSYSCRLETAENTSYELCTVGDDWTFAEVVSVNLILSELGIEEIGDGDLASGGSLLELLDDDEEQKNGLTNSNCFSLDGGVSLVSSGGRCDVD